MDYIWQVRYGIEPSLTTTEIIEGIKFQVDGNKTNVIAEHITENYDDITNTVCKEYIETLRNYLLRRMLYQKSYQPITIRPSQPPFLLNREELKGKGAKLTRKIQKLLHQNSSLLEVNDSLSESERFWKNGFTGKNVGSGDDIIRIASWLEKSESETDCIQKFILTWVAFNSLYGLYSRVISSQSFYSEIPQFTDALLGLLSEFEADKIFRRYHNNIILLSTFNLQLKNGNNCSDDLLRELNNNCNNSKLFIITRALECIYCIRNLCFHNGPQATDLHEYIGDAREILFTIVANCIYKFVKIL